jgi:6-phosphofructokinase 1
LDDIARVIEGSIFKRRLSSHGYGVAIVAEGVGERIDIEELRRATGGDIGTDPYGHVSLSDIPLAQLIKQRVQKRLAERGDKLHLTDVTLGYELRCRDPIPFDIDYTRTLGYAAVRFLLDPTTDERLADGGFVCLDGPDLRVMPFNELLDPATGRTRVRLVDIESVQYRVARDYMIRLERSDLEDAATCEELARAAHLSPEAFRSEYGALFADAAVVA